jgi:hypothetical protein
LAHYAAQHHADGIVKHILAYFPPVGHHSEYRPQSGAEYLGFIL